VSTGLQLIGTRQVELKTSLVFFADFCSQSLVTETKLRFHITPKAKPSLQF